MLLGGFSCLGSMLFAELNTENAALLTEFSKWLAFIGKFGISGSFNVIFIYAAELYPTEIRSIGSRFLKENKKN